MSNPDASFSSASIKFLAEKRQASGQAALANWVGAPSTQAPKKELLTSKATKCPGREQGTPTVVQVQIASLMTFWRISGQV